MAQCLDCQSWQVQLPVPITKPWAIEGWKDEKIIGYTFKSVCWNCIEATSAELA